MTTVTCNGCFDGLHAGHMFYLGYCLAQGTRLVVGVNTDDHIRRRKRPDPVPVGKRAADLLATGVVSEVIVFGEEDPGEFIRRVRPDVHCVSEEYRGRAPELPACAEVGARVVYVPKAAGWSSTAIRGGYGKDGG